MNETKITKIVAWGLGLFYVLFVGFFQIAHNFQASIFNVVCLAVILILLKARKIGVTRLMWLLMGAGTILSIYLGITTNYFIIQINQWTMAGIFLYLLLNLASNGRTDLSAIGLLKLTKQYLYASSISFFSTKNFGDFLMFWREVKVPKVKVSGKGLIVALPVVIVFHLLLAQVNSEYASFINNIFKYISDFINWIWKINIIQLALKTIVSSFVIYAGLSTMIEVEKKEEEEKAFTNQEILETVLFAVAGLFLVFFFFQIKTLFVRYSPSDFKTLSLFTQKGFWELIWVGIMGYGLCLLTDSKNRLRKFLAIFTGELIAMILFSLHKLTILVYWFGLKDQRVLALVAIMLILMTFAMFVGRIFGKIAPEKIFRVQMTTFLAVMVGLNVINMDLFIAKVQPTSNYFDGKKYKDYSYLLGNSYDDSSEWLSLMQEIQKTGAPQQSENYYWGARYLPLCQQSYDFGRYTATGKTYLNDKYGNLIKKYSLPVVLKDFNYNEYKAAEVLKNNQKTVDGFLDYAKNICVK